MELPITRGRVMRVWWALLWRHLRVTIGAMACGAFVGVFVGLIGVMFGAGKKDIIWPARIVGGLIGLGATMIPVWWILGRRFGDIRLVLVSATPPQTESPPALPPPALPEAAPPAPLPQN